MCQAVMVQAEAKQIGPVVRQRWMLRFFFCVMWLLAAKPLPAGNFYQGTSPATVPWTNGIVPYEFTNTLTAAETNTYFNGLREWELAANVQFVPHTNQARWILFTYNTNWIDNVSTGSAPQVVTVSSLSRAQVCHEMGHSFGFTHENIRPDATNYISVLTNNIADETHNIFFFTIDPTSVTNGPYDFESVMHLGWDFASTNPGVTATQAPKSPYFPRYQFRMGNYCLSPGDRAALAYLYSPATTLTNVVTTTADYGTGSLRAAIYYATDHPGTTIRFDIPPSDAGYSNGVFNIHLTGMLPPLVANGTVIDGSTQPGFTSRPLIVVDASQIIPETFTSDTFLIYSANNRIKNLAFTGFDWNGITLLYAGATNNTISGCWIGVDSPAPTPRRMHIREFSSPPARAVTPSAAPTLSTEMSSPATRNTACSSPTRTRPAMSSSAISSARMRAARTRSPTAKAVCSSATARAETSSAAPIHLRAISFPAIQNTASS
jgi:hypothetical protein